MIISKGSIASLDAHSTISAYHKVKTIISVDCPQQSSCDGSQDVFLRYTSFQVRPYFNVWQSSITQTKPYQFRAGGYVTLYQNSNFISDRNDDQHQRPALYTFDNHDMHHDSTLYRG